MKTFSVRTVDELAPVAEEFFLTFGSPAIFLLHGHMGAGKTTFVKALMNVMGAGTAQSPTFSIVNEYVNDVGIKIFHLDLYRVKSLEEALDFGVEEYLDSGAYIFIEWPDVILPLLKEKTVAINMLDDNGVRKISF
ncbi:MAG: tRNA (adenosine(37)-N6)-threonylcarbamoyltransferase complex ATPase subunit type 1 TsaE [Flavobacteriales bacterium]|nr:tRNA (adenosine(37)-N6)-threonylcarbamoyltransferase complex ATPase subunit type 1 TsaE [Flavobacteriales bacterium]